jgi:hypothetical protein
MTEQEQKEEWEEGFRLGESDFRHWIALVGIDDALSHADDKLSILMSQNGVVSAEDAKQKLIPYVAGMMEALEAFVKRHCAAKPHFSPNSIRKVGKYTYRIPMDGLGS